MTSQPPPSDSPLQIRQPCPKNWAELIGDERRRFCSECSLHVHNAAQLTQLEARTLVTSASARVCMRMEYDGSGTPIFRDTPRVIVSGARAPRTAVARLSHWALSAAAGLLAACHGSVSNPGANDPATDPNGTQCPPKMGKVVSTLMGDVAVPAPQPPEIMGEASVASDPIQPPTPELPPSHDGK